MNHSEVLEIRKRFTKTAVSAHRVTGCYVTGDDKQIRTYVDEMFLNLEEEEQFKYMELMKKSLSGTVGKNLLNLSFTNEAELEGGVQRSLVAQQSKSLILDLPPSPLVILALREGSSANSPSDPAFCCPIPAPSLRLAFTSALV